MKKWMKCAIGSMSVLGAAVIAIPVHALLPSPGAEMDAGSFDGFLVKMFGFPVVASMYFILLYLHLFIIICIYAKKVSATRKQIGLRYGLAFALMYMAGMQEVVVSASPLASYGIDFVSYQFFMGLGDAIPVFLLCLLVSRLLFDKNQLSKYLQERKEDKTRITGSRSYYVIYIGVIAVLFFAERVIGYYVGYLDSDIKEYPIPVLIWTFCFGIVLGIMYLLLAPIYNNDKKKNISLLVVSVGMNWIWFNCFMGLILQGILLKMFVRSAIDILVIFVGCCLVDYVRNSHYRAENERIS